MTPEFLDWRDDLDNSSTKWVTSRLNRAAYGHFGDSSSLGDGLFELRWKNGMRVYYTRKRVGDIDTIVLLGGFKGTQHADINKARKLKAWYERELGDGGPHA